MEKHRKPAVAGMFYQSNPQRLRNEIDSFISSSPKRSSEKVKFLISPHAGYVYSGKIAGESFAEVKGESYEHVILLGPSHRHHFHGMVESDSLYWDLPLGSLKIAAVDSPGIHQNFGFHENEHCLEVQLPFLHSLYPDARYSPILLSGSFEEANKYADTLKSLDSDETLWVISSDFNHVGPNFQHYPEQFGYHSGESMDLEAIDFVTRGDIQGFIAFMKKTNATICGALPILVAMHLIKKLNRRGFVFKSYDCSGKQTGDSNSVGYAALYC
ncbi:AmmeMemoRadiSam system protein B [bacterium]|nr:AmmeMemoRadiSam system protein B [bacterium]